VRAVDLFRRRPEDGAIEHVARLTVSSPDAPAELEVRMPEFREGLEVMLADGVPGDRGGWFGLPDGEAFLDAALTHFHGSRFWAEAVDDVEGGGVA
jgi:hypothetical protein